ncbi:uncharacterized protein LOC127254947 [Andrographis paniculata]|uniref:uncharacterized protein LOC127254947 n=1 Tax=Andrographis paniculata TaxID=175694 RepID=UPI0021E7CD66|nr:uncharacterized protein LOC127254947 [Andrographis paniculata]
MGRSSRKWAEKISAVASRVYFFAIILQIPLFRFPCRMGTCETPIEVMACQLIASGISPELVLKALLFPGAIRRLFTQGTAIPSPGQLLNSYKSKIRDANAPSDPRHLEVVIGSYLCVAGALVGLIKHGRIGLFGLLLVLWGIAREILTRKHAYDHSKTLSIYPEMIVTLIIAFFSVRRDVRKLMRICKPDTILEWLKPKHI